jgi:hypothetical protein
VPELVEGNLKIVSTQVNVAIAGTWEKSGKPEALHKISIVFQKNNFLKTCQVFKTWQV